MSVERTRPDRWAVGGVAVEGLAILAPMSGICDLPFRRLAARYGAALVVSEMVASDRLCAGETEARLKLEGEGLGVHVVQLAGCRAPDLAEAARLAEAAGANIIDLNMGCPAKRVVGGEAGSALMRDPVHAAALVEATARAVSVPVTVKMRLGFDATRRNAPEVARLAVAAGAKAITVHGRTRCQRYTGRADWAAIRATREAVDVPLIANGDIGAADDARTALSLSGADAVMVGRAAVGAPWLPGRIGAELTGRRAPDGPTTPAAVMALALEHLDMMLGHAGAKGVRLFRKHGAAYAAHFRVSSAQKRAALTAETPAEARGAYRALFAAAEPLACGALAAPRRGPPADRALAA